MESLVGNVPGIFGDVYKGKKVLVTGHTGFKGSWLSIWLNYLGADVVGYALEAPTNPSLFKQANLEKKIDSRIGDIRDLELLKRTIREVKPEFVFHLAAQPIVRLSYSIPLDTFMVNTIGTAYLLEAIKEVDTVRVCQIITTDKCYENNNQSHAFKEIDPLGGSDPYSASKAAAEIVVSSYRHSFFSSPTTTNNLVSVSSARAGNVIGGGDWALDRLVPDCIRALSQDKSILIRNPDSIRPWQHVLDALSGYLSLGAHQFSQDHQYSTAWNFGPDENDALSVFEVTKHVIKVWGKGSYEFQADLKSNNLKEAIQLRLDASKAKKYLGWKPVLKASEAIEFSTLWYLEQKESRSFDAENFTIGQIKKYIELASSKGCHWAKEEQIV